MANNLGKKFEEQIRKSFEKVPNVSIDRLHDQMSGFQGSSNICDFIVYREPYEYYFECKSVHGNTLSIHSNAKPDKNGRFHGFYGNITDTQWEGLLEKSKIPGVIAGVICWWVDKDITRFIPIQTLVTMREYGFKSYKYDTDVYQTDRSYVLKGKKKKVFFDYDMSGFLDDVTAVERWRWK